MIQWLRDRMRREGQSMVEFALILVLVACVAIATLMMTGNQLMLTYQDIEQAVMNPGDAGGDAAFTCPDGTTATQHGHKFHCHP
jgi:Flp pilus assembly pilin Flp